MKKKKLPTRGARGRTRVEVRRLKALALRTEGRTFSEIASELGVTVPQVHHDVSRALADTRKEVSDSAESYRQLEVQRLDNLMAAHWYYAVNPVPDKDGIPSTKSADFVLKCIKQRSELLGLNAPIKVDHSVSFQPQPLDLSVYTDDELDVLRGLLAKQAWGARLLGPMEDPILDAEYSVED